MFDLTITNPYSLNASFEIIIMLLVAFILGYLFNSFSKPKMNNPNVDDTTSLESQIKVLNKRLHEVTEEKSALKKSLIVDYSTKIDKLKVRLSNTRVDLEKCLSSKAEDANAKPIVKTIRAIKPKAKLP